jgi:hypothetical protein
MNKTLPIYQSENFTLHLKACKRNISFEMKVKPEFVKTGNIPSTISILEEKLPTVFCTKCYNYKNQSFAMEAKDTETGHLFEHILLEYLYQEKKKLGFKNFTINGRTKWNWKKYGHGVFHIIIDLTQKDYIVFQNALNQTLTLTEDIINSFVPTAKIKVSENYAYA